MKNCHILGIIPARGGSKGIKRKNIIELSGKPLISYTIEASKKSKYIDRLIVSTEDSEIKKIAEKFEIEVIDRPKDLARDDSSSISVVIHCIDFLENKNYFPDIIILLQPTSPLRSSDDIDNAIQLFLNEKCDSVVSCVENEHSPYWSLIMAKQYVKPLFSWKFFNMRRQSLPKTFIPNGAIFISSNSNLKRNKSFYNKNIVPYIMPRIRSVDIDSLMDLSFCEVLINKNNSDFNKKK